MGFRVGSKWVVEGQETIEDETLKAMSPLKIAQFLFVCETFCFFCFFATYKVQPFIDLWVQPTTCNHLCVVLGTQWGDEGKGKLVDILALVKQYVAICTASHDHRPQS
jgi:hypothetical protein